MVRMSDILKRLGQRSEPDKSQEEKPSSIPLKEEPIREIPQAYTMKIEAEKTNDGIRLSKAMSEKEGISEKEEKMHIAKAMRETQFNPEESLHIYNEGIGLMRGILNKAKNNEPIELKEGYNLIENIVERLVLGDQELLSLTRTSTSGQDSYLIAHSVNVTIFSIEMGLAKGYNKSRLNELGLAAFLHDIGMVKVMDIVNQPRTLTEDEYAKIREHPLDGTEILSKIKDIKQSVIHVVHEHHERLNGKGYPQHLSDGEINEYSQIISLCDIYEALTHERPYRKQMNNHEAIKEILTMNSEYFDAKNVKLFIKRLGVFPVGNWVELNTGEIGKVISNNEDFPLRPTVNLFFDMNKQNYTQIKSINLAKHQAVYIKKSVDLKDLNLKLLVAE